ncbi:hypothetical protein CTEN210_16830 [Chaetoceros tenuissimus]|uniref:Sulfotransferase n=1 Tax=Chaetoceros tenuissimus TaxID=426638 RepID=A0AAD3D9M8_9STRA|nr:hypothetical protein CTEN210_16830 [Chaetoceros tenuissimus]
MKLRHYLLYFLISASVPSIFVVLQILRHFQVTPIVHHNDIPEEFDEMPDVSKDDKIQVQTQTKEMLEMNMNPLEETIPLTESAVEVETVAPNRNISIPEGCESFDYGETKPIDENVKSIFNCGSQYGTCQWFYPAKFFDETCGVGREFLGDLNRMKELYESGTLWKGGPPIVLPNARITPEGMFQNNFKNPWDRHNIAMIHVHKTAGTSLVTSFDTLVNKMGAKGRRKTCYMPIPAKRRRQPPGASPSDGNLRGTIGNPPGLSDMNKNRREDCGKLLDGIVRYQRPDKWTEEKHTMFAVVRDPVDRFISAIGQATGATGSAGNGIGKQLLDECLKETSKETLNCFIDLMQTNSTWIELHFTHMALEISFATIYKDIPIALFPFKEVPNLLKEVGADPVKKKKDGHRGHRKSEILEKMSVNDYDEKMLSKICAVYKMDVVMMNKAGMATKCDLYVK